MAAWLAAPSLAEAAPLGPAQMFASAAIPQKLIMIGIVAAIVVSVVVSTAKLSAGSRLAGGSAFVSGLRLGGPIAGLLGGAYGGLAMAMGLANVGNPPTLKVLAPGFAEIATVVALGFLAGAVAVVLNWAIVARIDHEVLRG
ncbi:MAG TPA: hypothetical protein VKU90_11835 [Caulobacteraceae bacterium]|nr:hypothetical protein [Caulobacteraceae bacterium]